MELSRSQGLRLRADHRSLLGNIVIIWGTFQNRTQEGAMSTLTLFRGLAFAYCIWDGGRGRKVSMSSYQRRGHYVSILKRPSRRLKKGYTAKNERNKRFQRTKRERKGGEEGKRNVWYPLLSPHFIRFVLVSKTF